jgi:ATP-binding cassette subfamily F protein 3
MRQALSVALIEYAGALVVISHDRHLLRSVCDELLVVHDGIVDRFDRSLDEYPAWLKEQQDREVSSSDDNDNSENASPSVNRKQQRQLEARRRQRLKPLTDKVRDIEKQLTANRRKLQTIETNLADETIYTNPNRKAELTDLVKDQASLKSVLSTLEWDWMQASEALEEAGEK